MFPGTNGIIVCHKNNWHWDYIFRTVTPQLKSLFVHLEYTMIRSLAAILGQGWFLEFLGAYKNTGSFFNGHLNLIGASKGVSG